jgi:Arc/MetJ-type ribon-helix-helix transcriptional regulator
MKVSISLPDTDVAFLDRYARTQKIDSRSAVILRAVRLLQATELGEAYAEAWQDWTKSEDGALWDAIADDAPGTA